jgi:sortase A
MKQQHKKVKTVALAISPLLLSLSIVFILYLALGRTLSPVFSSISLLMGSSTEQEEQVYNDIFQGYEPTQGETQNTVDGNNIQFPSRGDLYARMSISSVAMEADIYFDDSKEALSRGGVGQYYGSRIPGYGTPILICGHNNGKFNALRHVKVGDIVTITTNYGIYEYKIRETAIKKSWDETAVNLKKEEEELILYTCYPFTALGLTHDRFFVYADKVSGPVVLH